MSALLYTDEQRAALATRDVAVAVDAGAGCGKTFVLTERFLSHLDPAWGDTPPARLDELVAITFTDAAAREMRGRIRGKCRERLAEATPEAAPFWRGLLRGLDAARVSTIHSFAGGLIREHAIELGIDPGFTVLDPAEAEVLKSAAVEAELRERLDPKRGEVDERLLDAAAELDVKRLRAAVRELADEAHHPEFHAWLDKPPEASIDAWRQVYRERVAPRYAAKFMGDKAFGALRELIPQAEPVKPGFAERLADLSVELDGLPDSDDHDAALKRLHPLLFFRDPVTRKDVCGAKDWPDPELKKQFSAAMKALRERLEKQARPGDPESMRHAAELGRLVHELAAAAAKRCRAMKQQRGVLDHDDLLVEAHRLLTDPALAEARDRVADKVRVVLVDEFQDTDRLQSALVQAIAGAPDGAGAGRLFFVGDFKQSIYRFRGAEPDVFRRLQDATPAPGRLTLSTNFRSQPAMLDFVNTLFAGLFGEHYKPLRPKRPQLTPTPAVELLWTPPPEPPEGKDKPTVDQTRAAEARAIAGRLRGLIDSGEPLVADPQADEPRPVRPGDIALLFRALSDVAIYEDALREAGLDYYLVGGQAFYAQQEVYDVINLLRSISSECDDIALAGALRSPLFGLPDEALYWLTREGSLNAGLMRRRQPSDLPDLLKEQVAHARGVMAALRKAKDGLPAAELLRLAWRETGYDAALLAEFLGERKLANLEKLHEQARQADASGGGLPALVDRLTEFLDRPPKEALAATSSLDAGVVRLMSVHASKGLEFPVVVLPDLDRKPKPQRSDVAFDAELGPLVRSKEPDETDPDAKKPPPTGIDFYDAAQSQAEEEEQVRLFYVACTRAADRLILSSCLDPAEEPQGVWLQRLKKRFDLATGELLIGENDRPLLEVVSPPPPASGAGSTARRLLGKALEAVSVDGGRSKQEPSKVGPVVVSPEQLTEFSVSRLSGRLHSSAGQEPLGLGDRGEQAIDPRRLGTLVHAVIERLPTGGDGLDEAIDRWAATLAPRHLRREVDRGVAEAARLVRRFVETPTWRAMRNAKSLRREVEFVLRWPPPGGDIGVGPATLRGYVDALYEDAGGAWRIVDYKTNSVDAAGVPDLADHYALQMMVYAHAVEAGLGVRPASMSLLFLNPGVEHRFAWDDEARARSIDVISSAIEQARNESIAGSGEGIDGR